MAITIDYSDDVTPQYVINIPRADMLLVQSTPTEIRQLNINDLRIELGDIQDNSSDIWAITAFVHTPPLTVAGVTLARVVEILTPYVIEFEDGLYNVNIVGGNSNIADVTIKNQVGVNTANSAGLQDPFALQAAAFEGHVSLDQAEGAVGTTFPLGTRAFPVNNVADAITIAETRGLATVQLLSDTVLSSGDFSEGFNFVGDNPNIMLVINPGTNIVNCEFRNLTVTGDLDGFNTLRECAIGDINYFNGFMFQCGISGTVSLIGPNTAVILQCFSLVAGGEVNQHANIDFGGVLATPIVLRDWQGGISISNLTSDPDVTGISIDMSSGRVIITETVTAGTITIRGIAELEDNSGGTAVIKDLTMQAIMEANKNEVIGTVEDMNLI